MSLATDMMGLDATGWKIKGTNRFLVRAAPGIAVGGGVVDASFETDGGTPVFIRGSMMGLGVGSGGAADLSGLKNEFIRQLVKYAAVFKLASTRSDLYCYGLFNSDKPTMQALRNCDLVLTTFGSNVVLIGGSLDYYAFYRKGDPQRPLWVWFAAGLDVVAGGSASIMQYKSDSLSVH